MLLCLYYNHVLGILCTYRQRVESLILSSQISTDPQRRVPLNGEDIKLTFNIGMVRPNVVWVQCMQNLLAFIPCLVNTHPSIIAAGYYKHQLVTAAFKQMLIFKICDISCLIAAMNGKEIGNTIK